MSMPEPNNPATHATEKPAVPVVPNATPQQAEIGGRDGPDPTRYGDWEKNGRCIDF